MNHIASGFTLLLRSLIKHLGKIPPQCQQRPFPRMGAGFATTETVEF